MYLIRTVVNVPLARISEFESLWQERQEALKGCPGMPDQTGIGLWTSLASPMRYLVLTAFDDYAGARAATLGQLGAFWRDHSLPAGATTVMSTEGWETVATAAEPDTQGAEHRYLRQDEWVARPGREAAFEQIGEEWIALVVKHQPKIQVGVLYRNLGFPGRFRTVFRTIELANQATPSPEQQAFLAAHPIGDYTDVAPYSERFTRAL